MATAFVEDLLVPFRGHFVRVSVRVWDPEPAVATAVCVHDFAGDSSDFSMLAMSLANAGIKTVAMDLPGRGASAFLGDAALYAPDLTVECLAQMNRYRQGPVSFIGSGWGAAMALLYLASSGNPVSRIVLHEPLLATGPSFVAARDLFAGEANTVFATFEEARTHLLARRANLDTVPEPLLSRMIEPKIRRQPQGFVMNFDPALIAATRLHQDFDLTALVRSATVPVLFVLSGAKDSPFRPWIDAASQSAHLRMSVDPDSGRLRPIMTGRQCAAVADFLAERPSYRPEMQHQAVEIAC